jgi:hypothetical protein
MRQIPQTTYFQAYTPPPAPHPVNGSSGGIGGAIQPLIRGVRRDFTYTPLFHTALTVNGQTGIPRG